MPEAIAREKIGTVGQGERRGQPDTVPLRLGTRTEANGKNSVPSSPRPRFTSIVLYSPQCNVRSEGGSARCAVAKQVAMCDGNDAQEGPHLGYRNHLQFSYSAKQNS